MNHIMIARLPFLQTRASERAFFSYPLLFVYCFMSPVLQQAMSEDFGTGIFSSFCEW